MLRGSTFGLLLQRMELDEHAGISLQGSEWRWGSCRGLGVTWGASSGKCTTQLEHTGERVLVGRGSAL